jgi:hypothetical protein
LCDFPLLYVLKSRPHNITGHAGGRTGGIKESFYRDCVITDGPAHLLQEGGAGLQVTAKFKFAMISMLALLSAVFCMPTRAGTEGTNESQGCFCRGTVGNIDCDYADLVTIEDLLLLADHLFYNFARLPNLEEANCSGDSAGVIDIVDLLALIDHMFLTYAALPNCPAPPNNPPETRILSQHGERFINSVEPGSPVKGVSVSWRGTDVIDHPYYPPPFEFEWRLYGPYDDSLFEEISDSFMIPVFIANDYRIFRFGVFPDTVWDTIGTGLFTRVIPIPMPSSMTICDTTYVDGYQVVVCDTMLIDTITYDNAYGTLDTLFDIDNPAFSGKPVVYDRVAARSFDGVDNWTYDTADTLYDVYANNPTDTTVEMNFVFWVRSRDPRDSLLYDPVPDFQMVSVIEARGELGVLVIDVGQTEAINKADTDSTRAFWTNSINTWRPTSPTSVSAFLPQRDFIRIVDYQSDPDLLLLLLKYKVMVLIQDAVTSSIFASQDVEAIQALYDALRSGVNTWVAMRTPLGSFSQGAEPTYIVPSLTYQQYFGVQRLRYSGWSFFARRDVPQVRIEDFVGATSQDTSRWPPLAVDSSLLHRRYAWIEPYYHWVDTLRALPGVGYCETTPEAEVMYTYNSLYGSGHFLGEEFSYEGLTVMHRMETELARTVHSLFTPLALEDSQAQVLVERVLNWLCCGEEP